LPEGNEIEGSINLKTTIIVTGIKELSAVKAKQHHCEICITAKHVSDFCRFFLGITK